jgi:hypothetical protein
MWTIFKISVVLTTLLFFVRFLNASNAGTNNATTRVILPQLKVRARGFLWRFSMLYSRVILTEEDCVGDLKPPRLLVRYQIGFAKSTRFSEKIPNADRKTSLRS